MKETIDKRANIDVEPMLVVGFEALEKIKI